MSERSLGFLDGSVSYVCSTTDDQSAVRERARDEVPELVRLADGRAASGDRGWGQLALPLVLEAPGALRRCRWYMPTQTCDIYRERLGGPRVSPHVAVNWTRHEGRPRWW